MGVTQVSGWPLKTLVRPLSLYDCMVRYVFVSFLYRLNIPSG